MFRSINSYLLIIVLVTVPLFFWGGPDYYSHRLLKELWNLGHLIFFALLAYLLDQYLCSKHHTKIYQITIILIILGTIAILTEVIQLTLADRDFSWMDLAKDISGGLIVLLWRIGQSQKTAHSFYYWALATMCLCLNLIPAVMISIDSYYSIRQFPLLAGFEKKSEVSRWEGNANLTQSASFAVEGNHSGKIEFGTEKYSGVFLIHFSRDWSHYNGLELTIFNPGNPLKIHYRVHDNLHRGNAQAYKNRYNAHTTINHGWNKITISMTEIEHGPEGRKMNIDNIESFGIFLVQQKSSQTLYIDNLRLF